MHEAISLEWKDEAACRGRPDADTLFWPPVDSQGGTAWAEWRADKRPLAFASCATCPVVVECGAYAEANGEDAGVWGGVDFGEKAKQKRKDARRRYSGDQLLHARIVYHAGRGLSGPGIARVLGLQRRTVYRHLKALDAS